MDNRVTTSNNNEITEEGAMPSSITTSGSNINYEGTTISNDNNIKEGMNSTSNNNEMNEDHVTVFVAYNGRWEYDRKEWFFENSKSSIMVVPKHITLLEITDILHKQLSVWKELYRLKLEVHYRTRSPWFPVTEIKNDQDLSVFISETSKTKLPLCVTQIREINSGDYDESSCDDDEERRKGTQFASSIGSVEKRLIKATQKNDWVKAREIVDTKEVTWTSKLDDGGNTALHFAVARYKDNEVVKDILRGINKELLVTTVDIGGRTPAHTAAVVGNTEALKMMFDSNPKCLINHDGKGLLPIHYSLVRYSLGIPGIKTFDYLFKQMKSNKDNYGITFSDMVDPLLLHLVIDAGIIDVAYELINDKPSLATAMCRDKTALECIVRKPELFYSGTQTRYSSFARFVYHIVPIENNTFGSTDTADVENQEAPKKDKFVTKYTRRCLHDVISRICVKLWETTLLHVPYVKHLKDDKVKHNTTVELLRRICEEVERTNTSSDIESLYSSPIFLAVENNTPEAMDVMATYFPGLFSYKQDGHDIHELTVLNRSEKIYRYILHHLTHTELVFSASKYSDGNNILHLAGRLAPINKLNVASGAALQMQRELQWFEEVKKLVGIALTRKLNKKKETPMMVFRKEHKELRKEGEEWMKKTADSYTITAALIITIVFAAAITVPGGNDSATGKPLYETKASLIIFAISDAISLFTATTSLLLFLSILTARYADEDFLYKLPKRLIYGLVMLFVSVTSMLIAFSAALYIMFGQGKEWILIPIAALACLPIASFVTLQFPLLVELISSTYGHGYFGKEKDYWQSIANANKKKRV